MNFYSLQRDMYLTLVKNDFDLIGFCRKLAGDLDENNV